MQARWRLVQRDNVGGRRGTRVLPLRTIQRRRRSGTIRLLMDEVRIGVIPLRQRGERRARRRLAGGGCVIIHRHGGMALAQTSVAPR